MVLKIPRRTATVIAIETTQVFMLKRKDFTKSLLKNPKVMRKIKRMAHNRFTEITKMDEAYNKTLFEQLYGGHSDHGDEG
nr:unnamed protein product [Callosobruchus analis]